MPLDLLRDTVSACQKQCFMPQDTLIEIIIMLDGARTKEFLQCEHLKFEANEYVKIIDSENRFLGPGRLWNKGLSLSSGNLIVFTWSGVYWHQDSLFFLYRKIEEGAEAVFGPAFYVSHCHESSKLYLGLKDLSADFISVKNTIPLGYTLIKRAAAELLGGFCENIEHVLIVDWEFLIRLVLHFKTEVIIGNPINIKMSLEQILKNEPVNYTMDESIRNFITKTYAHFSNLKGNQSKSDLRSIIDDASFIKKETCKIAIVSGIAENVQVQLCILNYLELLSEYNIFSWRRFLENEVKPEFLKDYDLVFFVRCRTFNAVNAARYCAERNIKTIYLLDDNWFCITETYPQLESQMGKMSEGYQFFITLIKNVHYVLVYNSILINDLREYADKILVLPVNVNSSYFIKSAFKEHKTTINIGFAGTQSKFQHFQEAFRALEKIMIHFKEVKLFFKGIQLPISFITFEDRIIQSAYTFDYKNYAEEISKWDCDIMISPLDNTRYTNSKCPNKYLEITAAGAAGIYSNTQLYQQVISHKYNGLIIGNNEKEWYQALKLLIEDAFLRENIIENARQEISKKYETKVILPEFIAMLESVLERKLI